MNTKELNSKVFPYILDCIYTFDYLGIELTDQKEKLQFLYDTFKKEYWHEYNQKVHKNIYTGFSNWIMGLPSTFNIEFENWSIIEIAISWGSIPENASEKQQNKILENWFNFITNKTFQLFKKYKIEM